MNVREYLMDQIAEECAEIAQRAMKANRFRLEEIQEGQFESNSERLIRELNDLFATIELAGEENWLPQQIVNRDMIEAKKEKLRKYMFYSRDLGTLR
jgi:RNA-splicing ligase RtcB